MKGRDFERISVSDICDECGMNRKSFYYHFKDKYDLVNWIFYVDLMSKLSISTYETGWDAFADLCAGLYEDRDFYAKAFAIEGQNSFRDYVLETIRPITAFFIEDLFKKESEQEFFLTFVTDAFLYAIMRWLQGGMQMTPDEFIENLSGVIVSLAYRIVDTIETEGRFSPKG